MKIDPQQIVDRISQTLKNLPQTIKSSPLDEQIAFGCIGLGVFLVMVFLVMKVVGF